MTSICIRHFNIYHQTHLAGGILIICHISEFRIVCQHQQKKSLIKWKQQCSCSNVYLLRNGFACAAFGQFLLLICIYHWVCVCVLLDLLVYMLFCAHHLLIATYQIVCGKKKVPLKYGLKMLLGTFVVFIGSH